MPKRLCSLIGAAFVAACATQPPPGPEPYLPIYRPLAPPPGGIVVYLTAALDGRLDIIDNCFVVVSPEGVPTLVSYAPEVRVVHARGRWGLQNRDGYRVMQGDPIGIGGGSHPDPERFVSTRLLSPSPPPACPDNLFVSNSSFGPQSRPH